MPHKIPEPWHSFLREVDEGLSERVEIHCLGAFVLMVLWDLPRPTGDIDIVEVAPTEATRELLKLGGEGSELSRKYSLQIHRVGIAEYPENYAARLIDITPPEFSRLRIMAFDATDVVLAKLARNNARDRQDVAFLAEKGAIARNEIQSRFEQELRPHLRVESREALALELWLEEFFPEGAGSQRG
jgi:hypothetical protein